MAPLLGTVLVTGGGGFLGSHIVDALAADPECAQVVATYRQERPGQHTNPLTTYHVCDVTDRDQIVALLEDVNPDIIVHTIMPGAFAPPEAQYHVNYVSTKQLLLVARDHPTVRALVYVSSAEAVGLASGLNTKPETEEDSVLCTLETGSNPYARTKGAADALVLASNSPERPSKADFKGHLLTTVIRFPGIYGPRDSMISERFYSMANTLGTRIQLGPNKAWHSWVYIESAVYGVVLATKALLEGQHKDGHLTVDGEAFFITDEKPIKFWDFASRFWKAAGDRAWTGETRPKVVIIPLWFLWFNLMLMAWAYNIFTLGYKEPGFIWRNFEYMRKGCWYSSDKANKRLGYSPVCDTDEGISRTVQWYQRNWSPNHKKSE